MLLPKSAKKLPPPAHHSRGVCFRFFYRMSALADSGLVVADCQLCTSELSRLDEAAEICAILPASAGGPWGEHWRAHCTDGPPPPAMPSGGKGEEYLFAVRPITREVAAQFAWKAKFQFSKAA